MLKVPTVAPPALAGKRRLISAASPIREAAIARMVDWLSVVGPTGKSVVYSGPLRNSAVIVFRETIAIADSKWWFDRRDELKTMPRVSDLMFARLRGWLLKNPTAIDDADLPPLHGDQKAVERARAIRAIVAGALRNAIAMANDHHTAMAIAAAKVAAADDAAFWVTYSPTTAADLAAITMTVAKQMSNGEKPWERDAKAAAKACRKTRRKTLKAAASESLNDA